MDIEIVSVLADGKVTPSLSRELRAFLPRDLPGSQAFTADGRMLRIGLEEARELARLLKGRRSIRVDLK